MSIFHDFVSILYFVGDWLLL